MEEVIKEEAVHTDWSQEEDIYDALVMAAFGGLKVFMPRIGEAKESPEAETNDPTLGQKSNNDELDSIRVHPIFVLPFVTVLFFIQSSVLIAMVFDSSPFTNIMTQDLAPGLRKIEPEEEAWFQQPTRMAMVLVVKCMMLFTLQVQSLGEFLNALKPLGVVLNVYNWFDYRHFGNGGDELKPMSKPKQMVHTVFIFSMCIIGKIMQLIVCYLACVVSLNVILTARDVQEVIFNGLVPLFITDLDNSAFSFLSAVLHVDLPLYRKYKLKQSRRESGGHLETIAEEETGDDAEREARPLLSSGRAAEIGSCLRCFKRFRGGPTVFVMFLFLMWFYSRQLFVTLHALDTGVVPAARDICMLYRAAYGDDSADNGAAQAGLGFADLVAYKGLSFLTSVVHIDLYEVLGAVGQRMNEHDQTFKEICLGSRHLDRLHDEGCDEDDDSACSDFNRLSVANIGPLFMKNMGAVILVMFVMFALLGVPQVLILWPHIKEIKQSTN
eukprot:CAMPEP_0178416472 /NCGR_PEP_ID=MMETSP0689_2-20121128/24081_1 /TAXON_ID=160604 /ORGANISM="Amphidinium massartii, Strain CS-259" /LENGTH=495 /DNA_ID=CAMNT_0020037817 /DNA_START=84 /DNA_END=1571 /DNA_ORIENTATION=-